MKSTRREFVKKSLATIGLASTFAISESRASGQILGANDRVGVVGICGQGSYHMQQFGKMDNV